MKAQDIAKEIFEATMRDGGCTVEAKTLKAADKAAGYFVGGVVAETVVDAAKGLSESFASAIASVMGTAAYIGTWVNEGSIYIDGSEWVETLEDAMKLGRERGELAIWDAGRGEEITL